MRRGLGMSKPRPKQGVRPGERRGGRLAHRDRVPGDPIVLVPGDRDAFR